MVAVKKTMNKKSLTISSLLIMAGLFIANQAGVSLAEGDLEQWITTSSKIIAVVSWLILYIKRIIRGDVKIFGGRI